MTETKKYREPVITDNKNYLRSWTLVFIPHEEGGGECRVQTFGKYDKQYMGEEHVDVIELAALTEAQGEIERLLKESKEDLFKWEVDCKKTETLTAALEVAVRHLEYLSTSIDPRTFDDEGNAHPFDKLSAASYAREALEQIKKLKGSGG